MDSSKTSTQLSSSDAAAVNENQAPVECGATPVATRTEVESKAKPESSPWNIKAVFANVKPGWRSVILSAQGQSLLFPVFAKLMPDAISPGPLDIFNWAKCADIDDLRVCIVGQDPYPNPAHAHGLAFSSREPKLPASLRPIFKALENSGLMRAPAFDDAMPGLLTSWAHQGVLLINRALTTAIGTSMAHMNLWKPFTDMVFAHIGALNQPIVYLLWGAEAHKLAPMFTNNGKALVIKAAHPSPLGQMKLAEDEKFVNTKCFTLANRHLLAHNRVPVCWDPVAAITDVTGSPHIVYTDGSSSGNGLGALAKASYAAYIASGPVRGTLLTGRIGPVHAPESDEFIYPTNIRGEGFAMVHTIEYIMGLARAPGEPLKEIYIVTDSKFWLDMVYTYIPQWQRDRHPWTAHKNPDLCERIWTLVSQYRALGGKITIRHTYAHGRDPNQSVPDKHFNDVVDHWAGIARQYESFENRIVHA